ncbi:MAG: chemotaxis protein CheW [Acidobacteria bacterium]|nr:MAG: chemotaxis protein CheW [Acidobacteriota bacterium]
MTNTKADNDYLCWREIGTAGDGSCDLLGEYVHCRNCPQYSAIGRTLFDREMSADYRQEVSEELAAAAAVTEETESLLILRTGSEWFALRTQRFEGISTYQKPYVVPFRSGSLLAGLVNVNGELLLCISLEAALGLPPGSGTETAGRPRLCVVGNGNERFAFGVDEILGVRHVPSRKMQHVPVTLAKSPSAQVISCFEVDGRNVGLIDEQRLFNSLDRSLQW